MAIDLLNLQPTIVSRSLKGKYILIYSQPKVGKTSFAVQLPRTLLVAFEAGYNALGDVMAQPVEKWTEFKQIVSQLSQDGVKEKFDTIAIDTVGIAYDKCEQYILQREGVEKIGDIPYGAGYGMISKEFADTMRRITLMGYGICLIAHSETRTIKNDDGTEYEQTAPMLGKRAYAAANQLVDIIGYIEVRHKDNGTSERVLHTRGNKNIFAGSRFKYLAPVIPFGYNELVNAISDAIDKQEKLDGTKTTDEVNFLPKEDIKRPLADTIAEAGALWKEATDAGHGPSLTTIVITYFGQPIRLSTATEQQQDLVEACISDIKKLLNK